MRLGCQGGAMTYSKRAVRMGCEGGAMTYSKRTVRLGCKGQCSANSSLFANNSRIVRELIRHESIC